MGAAKLLWENEVELVGDDYISGEINFEEAREKMIRLGFDGYEADDWLLNAGEGN